jgi:predicted RNase H-related nuclease YkuK (DUF458 family)
MKRSDMIKELQKVFDSAEIAFAYDVGVGDETISEWLANEVLGVVEKHGMVPPIQCDFPDDGGMVMCQMGWEKE